jgi:hypothetical protein
LTEKEAETGLQETSAFALFFVSFSGSFRFGTGEKRSRLTHNVKIEWETGELTHEPLPVIAADDPVTCALHAKENNLLDQPGWKGFKSIARRQKKLIWMVNQSKL